MVMDPPLDIDDASRRHRLVDERGLQRAISLEISRVAGWKQPCLSGCPLNAEPISFRDVARTWRGQI